jgi:O-antigen/teichoic acid export membrane protein
MTSGTKDTITIFTAKIITLLVGIGMQSCLAWFLAPDGRGSYAVCLIFASLLGVLCGFGIDVAVQYYVASKKMSVSEGVSVALSYAAAGSLLAVSLGIIMMQMHLSFFTKASQESFYLALLFIPISMLTSFFPLLLIGLRQFKWMAIFSIIQSVVQLVGVIFLVWVFGLGVNGALGAILFTGLIVIVLNFILLHKKYGVILAWPSINHLHVIFLYGIRYYFARFSNILNFRIGTIILAFFVSRAEIGFFAVATQLMAYVIVIPDVLSNVLMPRIAADSNGRASLVAQSVRLSGTACGAIIIMLLLISKPLVQILLSPAFLPIVPLMWILAPGIFVRSISKIMIPYFNGTNHPGISSIAVVSGVATNLVFLAILLPIMGLSGAAWAMTLGYFVSSFILITKFHLMSSLTFVDVWKYKRKDITLLTDIVRKIQPKAVNSAKKQESI